MDTGGYRGSAENSVHIRKILILNHLQIINVYLGQGTEEVRASTR